MTVDSPSSQSLAELILYATPLGPLADACAEFFAEASAVGPTTAQTYPPHCSLTGFFRRPREARRALVDDVVHVFGPHLCADAAAVEIMGLRCTDDWIGFELRSPWLRAASERFAARDRPGVHDGIRTKDWLHLSLAYGVSDLQQYRRLAEARDWPSARRWEIGLWERGADGSWLRHGVPSERAPTLS